MKKVTSIIIFLLISFQGLFAEEARDIVEKAYNHMRGKTSEAIIEMKINRPDFTRSMTLKAWSKGRSDGVFYVTAPKKDKGNGTLKRGRQMWTYNPRINRIIKLPPSMMSQSWMGSDFSNNDLSKTESMVDDYHHKILEVKGADGLKIYRIESIPKEDAAVVWGKVLLAIREDNIILSQQFQDQDFLPVKELSTSDIQKAGGRLFPMYWRMTNLEEEGRYTEIIYKELDFNVPLSDRLFTTSYMKSLGK